MTLSLQFYFSQLIVEVYALLILLYADLNGVCKFIHSDFNQRDPHFNQ